MTKEQGTMGSDKPYTTSHITHIIQKKALKEQQLSFYVNIRELFQQI